MKKILIVSTVSRQFYLFEQGNIEVLKSLGYEVHAAANYSDANERLDALGIVRHHIDIERSPFSLYNLKAYKQLKKLMRAGEFDAVHCHSPLGGVLGRLAARSMGISKVIYTAHGFHFFKGAPLINWLLYYPIEKFLSRYTDALITINKEDYDRAQKFNAKEVVYVPGIGFDIDRFTSVSIERNKIRGELDMPNNTIVILTVGEMIKRKNYATALKAFARAKVPNAIYVICGRGELENKLTKLASSLGIEDKVIFLGYRGDIPAICAVSDLFLFPSYQEGLPVSVMEAMAAGMPVLCSNIRGNVELIKEGKGGYLFSPDDVDGFANAIRHLCRTKDQRDQLGHFNANKILEFSKVHVMKAMRVLYSGISKSENKK